MKFGPFNGAYPGHRGDLLDAGLETDESIIDEKWQNVFDFNDPSKTGENWRLLRPDEHQGLWCPLGMAELCISSSSGVVATEQQKLVVEKHNAVVDDYSFEEPQTYTTFAKVEDQKKEGTVFHEIKAFVCGGWSIMWTAVSSVQEFCLNLFFKSFQPINNMLASEK